MSQLGGQVPNAIYVPATHDDSLLTLRDLRQSSWRLTGVDGVMSPGAEAQAATASGVAGAYDVSRVDHAEVGGDFDARLATGPGGSCSKQLVVPGRPCARGGSVSQRTRAALLGRWDWIASRTLSAGVGSWAGGRFWPAAMRMSIGSGAAAAGSQPLNLPPSAFRRFATSCGRRPGVVITARRRSWSMSQYPFLLQVIAPSRRPGSEGKRRRGAEIVFWRVGVITAGACAHWPTVGGLIICCSDRDLDYAPERGSDLGQSYHMATVEWINRTTFAANE